jgi:large subunit ribosomal protein L17
MRHGKKINHLGRKTAHRQALLSNMASSLIIHKRISTTVAKAKALRKYVEPLLTKSKDDTTHSRRTVFSYLQNKESVQTLFGEVASKIGDRPGGYTRIIKLAGTRLGDNAEMCFIELVDFNTLYTKESAAKKAKTRRSRRGGKKEEGAEATGEVAVADAPEAEKAEKKTRKKAAAADEPKAEKTKPASKPKKDKE